MPPKTRAPTTRARAALRARQEKEGEREKPAAPAKRTKTNSLASSKDSDAAKATGSPVIKRLRLRAGPSNAEETVTDRAGEDSKSKGEAKAKSKKVKMASTATSRKRRQKPTAAPHAGARGEGDGGESAEVKVETPPPSKRRKGDKPAKQVEPVEETDRVIVLSPRAPVAMEKHKNKPAKSKVTALPVEMEKASVISHHSHSKMAGKVFVMGQGDMGQLGLGEDMLERKKPHPVGGALENYRVVQVVCGGMHTVALTEDGRVFTWGCNDEGALGRTIADGEEFNPGVVDKLEGVKIVQVSAGDSHTAALTDNGSIYCWGIFRDSNGAFGLVQTSPSFTPELLYSQPSNRALKVSSGSDHVAFVTEHGDIYTFGCAEQGQLGRVSECFSSRGGRKGLSLLLKPDVVRFRVKRGSGKPKFADIFCGPYHTFAVTKAGLVYVWGLNNYGQLCTGDKETRFQPEQLDKDWIGGGRGLDGVGVAKDFAIASGPHHTVVCCKGDVLTCGRREYGRLGHGNNPSEPTIPTQVEGLKGVKVVTVEAGGSCSFLVTATGDLYSWGMGTNLQLGMADEEDVWSPEKVTGKKIGNRRTLSVSAGGQHTALLVNI